MAAKKKAKRKARLIYCVEVTLFSGPHIFYASYSRDSAELELAGLAKRGEGPGRIIVSREILPRTPAKRKGGRR